MAGYNNKNVEVLTPKSASLLPSNVPYAVQIDGANAAPQQLPPLAGLAPLPNEWEIGLFECCATPAHCCMAFFFPCINAAAAAKGIGWSGILAGLFFFAVYAGDVAFAITSETIQDSYSDEEYYYYAYGGGGGFNGWHVAVTICSLLFITGVVVLRHNVRAFYQIPGSSVDDCCCSFWCSCCVMSQMSAHTEKAKARRSANTATLPGYQAA